MFWGDNGGESDKQAPAAFYFKVYLYLLIVIMRMLCFCLHTFCLFIYLLTWEGYHTYIWHAYEDQRTASRCQLPPSITWVLGIELMSSGLAASTRGAKSSFWPYEYIILSYLLTFYWYFVNFTLCTTIPLIPTSLSILPPPLETPAQKKKAIL